MALEGHTVAHEEFVGGGSRALFQIGTVGKKERVLWLLVGAYS